MINSNLLLLFLPSTMPPYTHIQCLSLNVQKVTPLPIGAKTFPSESMAWPCFVRLIVRVTFELEIFMGELAL